MTRTYTNIHGRQPGRGLRPYLLLPKVLAVAVYFGGLVTMLALEVMDVPVFGAAMVQIHDWVLLPALGAAMLLGAALAEHHGSAVKRMRWLQAKVIIAVIGLIGGHVWLRIALTDAGNDAVGPLCVLIWLAGVVIVLGRHKPRLGQDPRK